MELDCFLGPEVTKLTAQIGRRCPLVEGSNCASFRRAALGQEIIDVDLGEVKYDLYGLLVVRQLVLLDLLAAFSKGVQFNLCAAEAVVLNQNELWYALLGPSCHLGRVEILAVVTLH